MAPSSLQHRRTHNLLLISKLFNQRETTSPFTLVIDSLEQSGKPLFREYVRRANVAKVEVVFVAFETLRKPQGVDVFVPAWDQPLAAWQKEVALHTKATSMGSRKLLIIDSLSTLAATASASLPGLLFSLINPSTSLLALYHSDMPAPPPTSISVAYSPSPLTLLRYLATTIFTVHSLHHVLAQKAARERSVAEPVFGLEEGVEGVLQGVGANGQDGLVLEMEYRRKSGRGVKEWYFLPSHRTTSSHAASSARTKECVLLFEDRPEYRRAPEETAAEADAVSDATFELSLTEKQRRDREGVVLPYFDAQKGGGEGGRILYDMGVEDDFDEEEDEI